MDSRIRRYGIKLLAIAVLTALAKGAASPTFEVASVKATPPGGTGRTSISPYGTGRFTATNATLQLLISLAFGMSDREISGGPGWLESERYDITAKAEDGVNLTYEQLQPRLQQLLAQRFNLATHREQKDLQGYALVVAKGGPKLKKSTAEAPGGGVILSRGLRNPSASMETLAFMLTRVVRRPVIDKTGIQGSFDIALDYAPDTATDSSLPSAFTALQERLGLKLESQKVPVDVLVIEHVEKVPTPD